MKLKHVAAIGLLMLGTIAPSARGQLTIDQVAEERGLIKAEREQTEQTYAQRSAECRRRFLEASCEIEANTARRHALAQLGEREAAVDQVERRQRAAERLERIRDKQEGSAARGREAAAAQRREDGNGRAAREQRKASDSEAAARAQAVEAPLAPTLRQRRPPLSCPAGTSADGAKCVGSPSKLEVEAFRQKQLEAQRHREAVEQRNAQREAARKGKPPPRPLPIPGPIAEPIAEPISAPTSLATPRSLEPVLKPAPKAASASR